MQRSSDLTFSHLRCSLLLATSFLLACSGAHAASRASSWRLGDGSILATISPAKNRLGEIRISSGRGQHQLFAELNEPFELTMSDGSRLAASSFAMAQPPRLSNISPGSRDARAAGRQLCTQFIHAATGLHATWCLVQPYNAHYMRETLTLEATDGDAPLSEVALLDLKHADARVTGTVSGSPAVAGNLYFGFEHPLSKTTVENGEVRASIARTLPLRAKTSVAYSSVIGVAAPGQMRRDFLAYIERERPRPYGTFLHYNSWYDLGYTNRFDEAGALDRIHAFGTELVQKRDVKLNSFLFDDGWDDPKSLWGFDKGFPDGFTGSSMEAAKYGAGIGVWLSPWGGYDVQKQQRIAYGRSAGYEIIDDGYALSGPRYYKAFEARCLEMIDKYHVNQFKFDGTGNASHVFPGSLFDSDFEAAITLITRLRKEEPKLFVNLTTGTFPSPFWLRYADSIWRDGEDHDFAGVGSWRNKWITYRDAQTYKNIVQAGPLFPLNSLMLHGLIWAKSAEHLETDPGKDFSNEVWSYFGNGTQLQEMYITPSLLAPADWDTLAKAAKWSRANQAVLQDSHWIGGDPGKLDVYGWASWSRGKSIIVLRNPSDKPQTFQLNLARALELQPGSPASYASNHLYGLSAVPASLPGAIETPLSLKAFEVQVIELVTPEK